MRGHWGGLLPQPSKAKMADNSAQVSANGLQPQEAESDGLRAKQFSGTDQVMMALFGAAGSAAKVKNRGLRFSKLLPPGCASDQQGNRGGGTNFDGAAFSG